MKHVAVLTLSLLILAPVAQAQSLCAQKEQEIQRQIGYAQQHNNSYRIAGLKKALSEVQAHCTDSKLITEHQEKVSRQKRKIIERQSDLEEARLKGDAEKIVKREKKLAEAESELKLLEKRKY